MQVHMIFDDWLLMAANQKVGLYGKDEITRNFKSKITDYHIACLDVQVKHMTIEPSMMSQKEALIAQTFNDDFCVAQEWLGPSQLQLMAVKKSKIEEIYQYCKPAPITSLVAYQMAMRAYLKSQNFLNGEKAVILVDDLKNMAVVTIFYGSRFTDSRRIVMREAAYLTNEIKRTWGSFAVNSKDEQRYMLLCNNKEWLNAFLELKLVNQSEVMHVIADYPVLEGLQAAKFTNNFILPKDLAQKKRRQKVVQHIVNALIFLILICVSGLAYGLLWMKQSQLKEVLRIQNAKLHNVEKELATQYQKTLRVYLQDQQKFDWAYVYADFMKHVPYGYVIKEFGFMKDVNHHWSVSALILPNKYDYFGDFVTEGIWKDAIVINETVNNVIGERITLVLPSLEGLT